MEFVAKQHVDDARVVKPLFVPAIATCHGELHPEHFVQVIQEGLVRTYRERVEREGLPEDGSTVKSLTAAFRTEMRTAIQVAIARAFARSLLAAGMPNESCRKHWAAAPGS